MKKHLYALTNKWLSTTHYMMKIFKLILICSKKKMRLLLNIRFCVNSVAFNHNGTLLASGSLDKTIKLWNLETKTEIATLEGHEDWLIQLHLITMELS